MSCVGATSSDRTNGEHLGERDDAGGDDRSPTSLPTITRSRCGSRSSRARNVPPENSAAISAMNVTNTRKPTNEAPTANASVPPPSPASAASVVPPWREAGAASTAADENTVERGDHGEQQRRRPRR